MIEYNEIRSTAKTALEAASALSGITIIQDDGFQENEREEALKSASAVILLSRILTATPRVHEAGVTRDACEFLVTLMINPQQSAALDTPWVEDTLVQSIKSAVIGVAAEDTDNDRYKFVRQEINTNEAGVMATDLLFSKGALS